MLWKCQYCSEIFNFEKRHQTGAHSRNCTKNPKYREIIQQISQSRRVTRYAYTLCCSKCGVQYSKDLTPKQYALKMQRNFCSRSCANSHVYTPSQKLKTQTTLKQSRFHRSLRRLEKISEKETVFLSFLELCPICNFRFRRGNIQTCGKKSCIGKAISIRLKNNPNSGGYRVHSGKSKMHGSYFNLVWMDSSWERNFAMQLTDLNIRWERSCQLKFAYFRADGKKRNYFPDFYLPDLRLYIEIKGFWTSETIQKLTYVLLQNTLDLIILDSLSRVSEFIQQLQDTSVTREKLLEQYAFSLCY